MADRLLKQYKKPYENLLNANNPAYNGKLYASRLPPKMNISDNNIYVVSKPKPKKK
jgi:hypothetical protein